MSYIDWSDPEEMFGLLLEFVADERAEVDETGRRRFLAHLVAELERMQDAFATASPARRIALLRSLHASVDAAFGDDPVVEHLGACADELERIHGRAA